MNTQNNNDKSNKRAQRPDYINLNDVQKPT